MIPAAFLTDLLQRTDIVEIVGRHVKLRRGGANFMGLCPFHGEKSPSFSVSPSKQFFHCFGCGAHGNAIGFLMEHEGLGFVEAVKDLAQQAGLAVPEDPGSAEDRERAARLRERQGSLSETLERAARHYRSQLRGSPRAIDYLKQRGLTGEVAARFGLGYAPDSWRPLANAFERYDDPLLEESGLVLSPEDSGDGGERRRYDRFRDRIMFPIRAVTGQTIGFGGRVLDRGEPKYLNSPETPVFSKGRELYGLFEARQALRKHGHALVVEGYMDVVALAQLGFENAVATLGTACTAEHVQKLFRFTDSIVFSFDGDAAGRRAAVRALEATLAHAGDTRSARFLFLPPEHDPDSYIREHGSEAFAQRLAEAVPLSQYLVEAAGQDGDPSTAEGRAQLLARARPWWQALPDGALKSQLLDALATRGGLEKSELVRLWRLEAVPTAIAPGGGKAAPGGGPVARAAGRMRQNGNRSAASLLDRALWLLLHDPAAWDLLAGDDHALLAEQAPPYGTAFALVERRLHDAGPEHPATLLAALREADAGEATAALTQRIEAFVPPLPDIDLRAELRRVVDRLVLRAVEDELQGMFESGPLSEDASRRSRELLAQRAELKSRLTHTAA